MTTEQTAQQLELAAQILRTGHPWGYRHIAGSHHKYNTPIEVVADGNTLSPLLATPPDNRPLHNPDNLTAEQVGVGYRLFLTSEKPNTHVKLQEKWKVDEWVPSGVIYADHLTPESNTYRLPLSVPWPEPADPYAELKAAHAAGKAIQYRSLYCPEWRDQRSISWNPPDAPYKPEYRIKPTESAKPEPAFQLPPPPPGMRWHREGGWKENDLPQGYRPCVVDEREEISGYMESLPDRNSGLGWVGATYHSSGLDFYSFHHRTTRPLVFNHAGKTWTWHRPGDPTPCDGERMVHILTRDNDFSEEPSKAEDYEWNQIEGGGRFAEIIGWRYADEKKTVPLGPEDVPPGSVFRGAGEAKDPDDKGWCLITSCSRTGIRYWRQSDSDPEEIRWLVLNTTGAQINRSLPLTGKWNPDAWEPCSKTIPA